MIYLIFLRIYSTLSQVRMRVRPWHGNHPSTAYRGGVSPCRHLQAEVLQEVRRVGQVGGLCGHYRRIRVPIKLRGERVRSGVA